jgi:type IV secretion system protein VirB6
MACEAVFTGQRFVAQTLAHIDCQAQAIGAYGFGALSDPSSPLAMALTGLFTIFAAILGLRLMVGDVLSGRDLVGDALRIGAALTLAVSWPAWRTLGYDVVMKGPGEIAAAIGGAAGLPGQDGDMVTRMQLADDGIVMLTVYGTGRNTGGTNRSDTIGDSFRGIAIADLEGLGKGRITFLVGLLGPLALVRLSTGLLLALAPLMAGLLLFAGTRDLFFGWLRGLAALALGAVALAVIHGVELAVLEPWLRDALSLRDAQILTPSIPTELVALTMTFAVAAFGSLFIVARVTFFGGFGLPRLFAQLRTASPQEVGVAPTARISTETTEPPSRAFAVAEAVAQSLRREGRSEARDRTFELSRLGRESGDTPVLAGGVSFEPLGSSFRGNQSRRFRRHSAPGDKRDHKA